MKKELFEVIYNLIKDGKMTLEQAYGLLEKLFEEDSKESTPGTVAYPYWWDWTWRPYYPYNPVWYTTTCSTGDHDFKSTSTYPVNESISNKDYSDCTTFTVNDNMNWNSNSSAYSYCGNKGRTFTC